MKKLIALALILTGCNSSPVNVVNSRTVYWQAVEFAETYNIYVNGTNVARIKELEYNIGFGECIRATAVSKDDVESEKSNEICFP